MSLEEQIEAIIEPALNDMGFDIVRIQISGGERKTLQVMIDRQDGANIHVDHCADASRAISVLMDVEDPIADEYVLEVSSSGLDRPLVKLKDFERFAGEMIKYELKTFKDGQKRFRGQLKCVDGNVICIVNEGDESPTKIEWSEIKKAKLIPQLDV